MNLKNILALSLVLFVAFCLSAVPTKAESIVYVAQLSGPAESPPNASPGTGFTQVTFDPVAHTMRVQVTFSGLLAGTTASHIHAPTPTPLTGTAGVATQVPTFIGFPLGVTSGNYDQTFDTLNISFYNPTFVPVGGTAASAEAALAAALAQGRAYLNIHTTAFTSGEIRGFLQPVPETATMLLLGTGLAGIGGIIKKKR